MSLIDRDRRYVAVNDAHAALFKYRREDIIGKRTGAIGGRSPAADEHWEALLATGELYQHDIFTDRDGTTLQFSFAAHATNVQGRWLALAVILCACVEPNGPELVGTPQPATVSSADAVLTPRKREVVGRIALGATNREIASALFVSPATVRAHVRNSMSKTQARTRAQLVAIVLGDRLAGVEDLVANRMRAD